MYRAYMSYFKYESYSFTNLIYDPKYNEIK